MVVGGGVAAYFLQYFIYHNILILKKLKMKTIIIAAVSIILVFMMGCLKDRAKSEEITIEGIYCKDIGHPYPGPALLGAGGYYRLSGENAQIIHRLKDKTKIKVSGRLHANKRMIPEAGTLRELIENVIEVKSFKVLN
jgi:hypothetical protein